MTFFNARRRSRTPSRPFGNVLPVTAAGLMATACSSHPSAEPTLEVADAATFDVGPVLPAADDGDAGQASEGDDAQDATAAESGAAPEAGLDASPRDGAVADAAADSFAEAAARSGPPQAFVRIADWSADAPASGFDVCLAPRGTQSWIGPILGHDFDAGTLGGGGPNGVQFPWVTAYVGVAPGTYDLQLVQAGARSCAAGVIPTTTGLPTLQANQHETFVLAGDVHATDNDPSLKVAAVSDDTTVADGHAAVRFINASPALAAADVGTGSLANHNFALVFAYVGFGTAAQQTSAGGSIDPNGYVTMAPLSGVEFSAHAPDGTVDVASAAHVSAASGAVVTLALVHGENGGLPPQILACTDNATPEGALTPCTILPHE